MLEKIRLFANIPPECLFKLERTSSLRKYPKNTILFMEGDDNAQLFIIKSGLVCIHTDDNEGRQLVLNYMGPGEYFGELALLDDKPRSASASTVEDSAILSISREHFRAFMREYPELYEVLMVELVDRIRALTENVKDMALLDVYGRVAHTLERLCGEPVEVSPKLTHQDIANMVGASREMVSRVMKELVIGGYIEIQQKHIRILKSFPKNW
ncbi:MAG: Crp/Fnr family transcriptional regulator [Cellvibrionaceae bacterium]|nr:Crp/Fnr family transcriptional regulator [Cellvibrionaceae bacterium]